MGASKIQWTDRSDWNPFRGCTRVSPGCGGPGKHGGCYAEKIAARFSGPGQPFEDFATREDGEARWTGKVALIEDHLTLPLRWKKPSRIFVNSMSDLFHESIPDEWIDRVFAVMALAPQHTFQVLTKRSARMRGYLTSEGLGERWLEAMRPFVSSPIGADLHEFLNASPAYMANLAHEGLQNVWLGVSAEDQRRADERVPDLLATPAAVRFVSAEPLLSSIDFGRYVYRGHKCCVTGVPAEHPSACGDCDPCLNSFGFPMPPRLDQVIVGGESGAGARPCWTPDVRSIVQQCRTAKTAVFVKQLGANVRDRNDAGFNGEDYGENDPPQCWPDMDPADIEHDLDGTRDDYQGAPIRVHLRDRKGGDMAEWPEDLRVREMPERRP